jgi:hypothetical protein
VDAKAGATKVAADTEMKDEDSSSSDDSEDEEDAPKAKPSGKIESVRGESRI